MGNEKQGQGIGVGGRRPASRRRLPASFAQFVARVKMAQELKERILFLKEPCGNVIENKGWLLKTLDESGNVIENKGTCGFNPGMLLKAKELNKTLGISEHQETTRPSPKLNGEMPRVTS